MDANTKKNNCYCCFSSFGFLKVPFGQQYESFFVPNIIKSQWKRMNLSTNSCSSLHNSCITFLFVTSKTSCMLSNTCTRISTKNLSQNKSPDETIQAKTTKITLNSLRWKPPSDQKNIFIVLATWWFATLHFQLLFSVLFSIQLR